MAGAEQGGRERILARIREAAGSADAGLRAESTAEIFPPVGDALARFCAECQANGTECLVLADWPACGSALAGVLGPLPPGEIFAQDAPALRRVVAAAAGDRFLRWSSEGAPAESSAAAVTLAEALVAETGSVLVSTACGGRGGSVVAPVHVVLAGSAQLVGSVGDGLAAVRANGALFSCSSLSLITGPSRTADIEKILVRGAHGPRRLVVLVSQEGE